MSKLPPEAAETLGRNIREARKRLGLSQRAAAKRIGISFVWLNRIEQGYGTPTVATLLQIARGLERKSATLLKGVEGG
jgi:transcriptional regulator with XRE-family HTH domain